MRPSQALALKLITPGLLQPRQCVLGNPNTPMRSPTSIRRLPLNPISRGAEPLQRPVRLTLRRMCGDRGPSAPLHPEFDYARCAVSGPAAPATGPPSKRQGAIAADVAHGRRSDLPFPFWRTRQARRPKLDAHAHARDKSGRGNAALERRSLPPRQNPRRLSVRRFLQPRDRQSDGRAVREPRRRALRHLGAVVWSERRQRDAKTPGARHSSLHRCAGFQR